MAKRIMSDAEIKRRKKVQGHVSQATGALGLAALGGTIAATPAGRRTLRKIPKLQSHVKAPVKDPNADKLSGITTPVLATSAGLGGLGAFNFASYTGAESRKRAQPVTKNHEPGIDMGYFGEEGHPVKLSEIEVAFEKAWEPVASNFDSESSRGKRAKIYEGGALAVGGAGAAAGAHQGYKAFKAKPGAVADPTPRKLTNIVEKPDAAGKMKRSASSAIKNEVKGITMEDFHAHQGAVKAARNTRKAHGKKAAIGLGVAGLAAGAHHVVRDKRKQDSSWQPYSKRDSTSAFGVDHGVEFGKDQEHWTTKSDASKSRIASGILFAGPHGLVAGKPGKKLKAAGHEVGGALVGSPIAGPIGSSVGAGLGTRAAQNKGYYKRSKPIKTTAMKTRELHASLEKEKKEKGH